MNHLEAIERYIEPHHQYCFESRRVFVPYADRLVSSREAAAILGIHPRTLQRRRQKGCSPPYYKGKGNNGSVSYAMCDLMEWRSRNQGHSTIGPVAHAAQDAQRVRWH